MVSRYEERDGHMWLIIEHDSRGMHTTEQDLGEIYKPDEEKEIKPKRKRRK